MHVLSPFFAFTRSQSQTRTLSGGYRAGCSLRDLNSRLRRERAVSWAGLDEKSEQGSGDRTRVCQGQSLMPYHLAIPAGSKD